MRFVIIAVVALFLMPFGVQKAAVISDPDVVQDVERVTLYRWEDAQMTWFLPRVTPIPGRGGPTVLMTLQEIGGSDYYGPVHWRTTADLGKTWTAPQPVPGWGRKKYGDDAEEAVCDVVPLYHPPTGVTLAVGQNVYYKDGRFFREQPHRFPYYTVRDANGNWATPRVLEWNDPRATEIHTNGSGQNVILPGGDILMPLSFTPIGRLDRSVTSVVCGFDGKTLTIKRAGRELRNTAGRGLLEPSLVFLAGRYYMTIRAEDGMGYVSTSSDGLDWSDPVAWRWTDEAGRSGDALGMSTTQQHWLAHSDALYLVYTRRDSANEKVMRWRAPLYMAQVDRRTLRLLRATERIVFPLRGDAAGAPQMVPHYGNFHVNEITRNESWILSGEVIPGNFHGDLLMARVRWKKPNRLAK
ncbi:MAG: sialidase family protein [Blastocatellia bacterium]